MENQQLSDPLINNKKTQKKKRNKFNYLQNKKYFYSFVLFYSQISKNNCQNGFWKYNLCVFVDLFQTKQKSENFLVEHFPKIFVR